MRLLRAIGSWFKEYLVQLLIEQVPTKPPVPRMSWSTKDGDYLTDTERGIFVRGLCPDCVTGPLREGPHGGGSVNWYCGNVMCQSRFNEMGPFGIERISNASPAQWNQENRHG
jgi:hypothetical protein